MRAKLVRDNAEAGWTTPLGPGQTLQSANSLAGKHMALVNKLFEESDEISRDATNPEEYADLLEAMIELASISLISSPLSISSSLLFPGPFPQILQSPLSLYSS